MSSLDMFRDDFIQFLIEQQEREEALREAAKKAVEEKGVDE